MPGQPVTTIHLQMAKKAMKEAKKKLKMPKIKLKELWFEDIRDDELYKSLITKGIKINYEYDFSAQDIFNYFKALEDLGYSKFSFGSREDYGSSITLLSAHRMESMDEAKKRIDDEKNRNKRTEQSELELYNRLKQKYDKPTI